MKRGSPLSQSLLETLVSLLCLRGLPCLLLSALGASVLIVVCLRGLPCLLFYACPVVVVLAAAGLLLAHTTLVANQGIRFQICLVLYVCQIASALLWLIGM